MKKVLVVFQEIPDDVHLFMMECNDIGVADLKKCHGMYINGEADEEISELISSIFFDPDDGHFRPDVLSRELPDLAENISCDLVIFTGIVM